MTYATSGYMVDALRHTRPDGSPLSNGGDLYGRGRNATYSCCMRSFSDRGKPSPDCRSEEYELAKGVKYGEATLRKTRKHRARA